MRYLEWLFPIQRYVRLRKEVSGWIVLLVMLMSILGAALVYVVPTFISFARSYRTPMHFPTISTMWHTEYIAVGPGPSWPDTVTAFASARWPRMIEAVSAAAVLLMLVGVTEFLLALIFVRKRPGRRRPLCTWQTLKYVLLGSHTWMALALMLAAIVFGLQALPDGWLEPLPWEVGAILGILAFVALPLILIGSQSAQAANAVVVLQDDRRCANCGYFLIGLTTPRCPECGMPFNPAKLAMGLLNAPGGPEADAQEAGGRRNADV